MLSGLKLDYLLDSLHVAKPSLVESFNDVGLSADTLQTVEEMRRRLEGISVSHNNDTSPFGTQPTPQTRSKSVKIRKSSERSVPSASIHAGSRVRHDPAQLPASSTENGSRSPRNFADYPRHFVELIE
jgi:hypothetical protein